MKKILIILSVITIGFMFKTFNDEVIIPESAIRFRVIANSNDIYDQEMKKKVKVEIEKEITSKLDGVESIDSARKIISNNLPEFNNIVEKTLKDNNYDVDYAVNYGLNHFPEKIYKGVTYEEGEYESLVITLGSGNGDNWWCVLFPPLCLLEAEEEETTDDVEYKFFIKELIDKYF